MSNNTPHYRTIALVTSEVGAGSTRFALTGPGPHLYQHFDRGLEGTKEDVERAGLLSPNFDERAYAWEPRDDGTFDKQLAIEIRDQFTSDLREALGAGYRLITWDKEDQVWQVFRYAEFGAETGQPRDFAALNRRYLKLINMVKDSDASLIAIDSFRTPWEMQGGKLQKTKRRERRGFDELDRAVMVEVHMRREPSSDPEHPGPEYFFDVSKCRQNSALQDQTFPAMTFSQFGTLLVPGSTEEEWK